MVKTKTVWKVVRARGEKRFSAIISEREGAVLYNNPVQPTAAPKGTKLLAFRRLKDARNFMPKSLDYEIWKAEAKDVKKQTQLALVCFNTAINVARFARFWGENIGVPQVPEGTVSCSELTLLEKVG